MNALGAGFAEDRTFKLHSGKTSEYGRYVKSLWEAPWALGRPLVSGERFTLGAHQLPHRGVHECVQRDNHHRDLQLDVCGHRRRP